MNFHTGTCLLDKLDLFLLKTYIFPLPSSSWQSSPSFHQVTMISVFLGCHCEFAERKEFAVPGDYLCSVGCNHRVRKGCYRHHSKETWQQKSASHSLTTAVNAIVKQFIVNFKKCLKSENCSGSWYSQCCFYTSYLFFIAWDISSLKEKMLRTSFTPNARRMALYYFLTLEYKDITQKYSSIFFLFPKCVFFSILKSRIKSFRENRRKMKVKMQNTQFWSPLS